MNINSDLLAKCPICASDIQQKDANIQADLYVCKNCELQYIRNIAVQWDENSYEPSLDSLTPLRKENFTKILNTMNKIMPRESYGLEVGSGIGIFIELAQEAGYKMKGIEPLDKYYNISKSKGLDVEHGFFPDDLRTKYKFDFIIFNDVFEHLLDCQKVVRDVCTFLKPGGLVIINLPVTSGIIYKLSYAVSKFEGGGFLRRLWQIDTFSPHMFYFNDKSLNCLMLQNGFHNTATIDMKTLTKDGIKDRIDAMPIGRIRSMLTYVFVLITLPVLHLFSRDIKCFIYKLE